jgi:hypothetical protein
MRELDIFSYFGEWGGEFTIMKKLIMLDGALFHFQATNYPIPRTKIKNIETDNLINVPVIFLMILQFNNA